MPAVYAPKAALGHSLGAAGAVEAVLTVQALRDGVVPPTLNLKDLDPEIELDVVSRRSPPRRLPLRRHQFLRHRRSQRRGGLRRLLTGDYPFVRVNCPSSLMPRRKKSAHPVR